MKRVIATGWCGTAFAQVAALTLPLQHRYAIKHGVDFAAGNVSGSRPPSWQKVRHLMKALEMYDQVLWLDADVVVLDGERSIFDELESGSWHGLVEHETATGLVPNCGVWLLTPPMLPLLHEVWECGRHVNHCWWEQAAVLEQMGYSVTDEPRCTLVTPTPLHANTCWLGPQWNHHPADARRVDSPAFVHATAYTDRLKAVRLAVDLAKWT